MSTIELSKAMLYRLRDVAKREAEEDGGPACIYFDHYNQPLREDALVELGLLKGEGHETGVAYYRVTDAGRRALAGAAR